MEKSITFETVVADDGDFGIVCDFQTAERIFPRAIAQLCKEYFLDNIDGFILTYQPDQLSYVTLTTQ